MVSGLAALRTAASCAAVTRLSCTSTPCFQRCQRLQVSPRRPALFPAPQKPTSPATVIPLRQIPVAGLDPLSPRNRHPDHFLSGPVSASPNPLDRTRRPAWQIGSKTALQPPAPFVAAPAPLRARGFSNSPRGWRPRDVGWSMEQGWRPCKSSSREREWCWQHRQPWHGHRPGHPLRGGLSRCRAAFLFDWLARAGISVCLVAKGVPVLSRNSLIFRIVLLCCVAAILGRHD